MKTFVGLLRDYPLEPFPYRYSLSKVSPVYYVNTRNDHTTDVRRLYNTKSRVKTEIIMSTIIVVLFFINTDGQHP